MAQSENPQPTYPFGKYVLKATREVLNIDLGDADVQNGVIEIKEGDFLVFKVDLIVSAEQYGQIFARAAELQNQRLNIHSDQDQSKGKQHGSQDN